MKGITRIIQFAIVCFIIMETVFLDVEKLGSLAYAGTSFTNMVTVPTDITLIPYPQYYQNMQSTTVTIDDPYCAITSNNISYPISYLGTFPLPTIQGAPLTAAVRRGATTKDYWAYGLTNASTNDGCSGDLHTAYVAALERLKKLGVDHVGIYQDARVVDINATSMQLEIAPWSISDAELTWIVAQATALGLQIHEYRQINTTDANEVALPTSPTETWASNYLDAYTTYLVERAREAEQHKIEAFQLDWGVWWFDWTPYKTLFISKMINAAQQVRSVYSGKIMYGITAPWISGDPALMNSIDWFLGDFLYSSVSLSSAENENITVALMKQKYFDVISWLVNALGTSRKPMVWHLYSESYRDNFKDGWKEDGFCVDNCMQRNLQTDFSVQAIAYEATLEAIAEQTHFTTAVVDAINYWYVDVIMPQNNTTNTSFPNISMSVRNKPAESIVYQWFTGCMPLIISPSSYASSALGNTGTIIVTPSSSICTWTATSNASWITITSGANGTGTGTVSYSFAANTGSARTGTITAGGQTFTVYQAAWSYSNSIDSHNSVKVTDMSGNISSSGATITVRAWDANGNSLTESGSAAALKLYSNGTTTITGTDLAARFSTGTPTLYALSADSSKYIITNVKISTDGTLNIPNGYASDTAKFITNSVGARNSIKITDMSGTLSASGATITVTAWDTNGVSLTESTSANPLKLYSHGTTTISGPELQARFPSATPMSYEFTVASTKYVIVNVKSSSDGSTNIPYAFTSGSNNFVANSIGARNTIKITDMSGTISTSGAAITISAWDVNGNALNESGSATSLKLYSHGTTTITGTELQARFPAAIPMAYEFTVNSTKYIITNTKSSTDGTITIPFVYTSGTTNYTNNSISSRNTIKITDMSGTISASGAAITITVWDVNGNALTESGSATPLKLYSNGTTTITGTNLIARFPSGTPVSYEFTIGSTQYVITNLVANTDGTINVPSIYSSGVAGI